MAFRAFFITCSYSRIVKMVVYSIPCILLFGAELTDEPSEKVVNNKTFHQNNSAVYAVNLKLLSKPKE